MTLLLIFVVCGAITALIGMPLMNRRIPPNHWYGFRVKATLSDPVVWYVVNEAAGRVLTATGVATMVVAVLLFVVPGIPQQVYFVACTVVAIGGSIAHVVAGMRALNRMRK